MDTCCDIAAKGEAEGQPSDHRCCHDASSSDTVREIKCQILHLKRALMGVSPRCAARASTRRLTSRALQPRRRPAPATGSTIEGSSFSGLFTRVEIGHMRIRSAEKG